MRIAFLHSDKPRERLLADAFLRGVERHGHETSAFPLTAPPQPGDHDVVALVGVKSRDLFTAHHRAGAHVVYLDKGYARRKASGPLRGWEYWRVSLDAHHPTSRLMSRTFPSDRWDALGLRLRPWRDWTPDGHVLIAGSSAKYHAFYGLKEPTPWTKGIVRQLRALTGRDLVYRPKPTWNEAVPVTKTRFSRPPEGIGEALSGAHVVVTHGSNACFEAVLAGVPCIILGDAVARPISSTDLGLVENPILADEEERLRWCRNLAYWQWTVAEFASGEAWGTVGEMIHD